MVVSVFSSNFLKVLSPSENAKEDFQQGIGYVSSLILQENILTFRAPLCGLFDLQCGGGAWELDIGLFSLVQNC